MRGWMDQVGGCGKVEDELTGGRALGGMGSALFLLLVLVLFPTSGFPTAPSPELSQAEMTKLANKELVVRSREVSKCPWPEITVFTVIDASPAEAAALFSNYQDQKNFVPDLVRSTPTTRLGENETVVDFEMRLPWPLANSRYSTRNVLTRIDNDEYQLSWNLVGSDCLVDSRGTVQFAPFGDRTLFRYRSLIHPGSKFSSAFTSKARTGVSRTVQAIASYIEDTRKHNPEKTRNLVSSLPK